MGIQKATRKESTMEKGDRTERDNEKEQSALRHEEPSLKLQRDMKSEGDDQQH